jgi:hypothetical protein
MADDPTDRVSGREDYLRLNNNRFLLLVSFAAPGSFAPGHGEWQGWPERKFFP